MRMVVRLPTTLTTPPEIVRDSAGLATQSVMLRLKAVLLKVTSLPAAPTCNPAVKIVVSTSTVVPGTLLLDPMPRRTICGVLVTVGVLVGVAVTVKVLVGVAVGVAVLVKVAVGVLVCVAVTVRVLVGVAVGAAVRVMVAVGVLVGVAVAVKVLVGVAVGV